ncbi:MAG TPA: PilZ domain-containing protein [Sphingomicrobium sp.]|jgi:hypothetical protein
MEREPIDWLPRAARRRVSLTGFARWEDGSTATVLVSNISYEGCHLWSDHEFANGEILDLTLPRYGKIEAQIRWVTGGSAGANFLLGASVVEARRARIGV